MNMMQKLEKVLDLAIAYFEQQLGGASTTDAAPKKTRTKKETTAAAETAAPAPTPAPAVPPAAPATPATPAVPEMTDEESYKELCRHVAAFIAPQTPGEEERRAFAIKHVADTYKVDALNKVPHGPQRTQLIQWVKDQLVKKNTPAPAPSGFGV